MVYGLTRNGGNSWLLNVESDWMQGRNIRYKLVSTVATKPNRSRGCIYQNLSTNFGNTNIKRFKKMMKTQHGEIMFVRDKLSQKHDVIDVKQIRCCAGVVYLGKYNNYQKPENSMKNDYEIEARQWVKHCINNGITVDKIKNIVHEWAQPNNDKNNHYLSLENSLCK